MRSSNRDSILDAAIRVIDRDGITAITFDSVAAEAHVTRGGMLYHFRSREILLQAINQHLAARWEANLVKSTGKRLDQSSTEERQQAYVRTSAHAATRAELLFLLEFSKHPDLSIPWSRIVDHWSVPEPLDLDDAQGLAHFIVRLAADGLWAYEYVSGRPMCADLRQRVVDRLTEALSATIPQSP